MVNVEDFEGTEGVIKEMLDLDPRFLGAVSTPGVLNITKPFDTVCWSKDNQVALITDGGGIFVVVS